jgi:hypothetical protein
MLFAPYSVPVAPAQGYGPRPDGSADDSADESADGREPADSAAAAAAGARDGEGSAG